MKRGSERRPAIPSGFHRRLAAGAAMLFLASLAPAVRSANVDGSASVTATSTDSDGAETDFLEEQYNLRVSQRFTPYLRAAFGYQQFDFNSEPDAGAEFERSNREPRLDILYTRERLSATLSYLDRSNEGSQASDNFDARSLSANVSWKPSRGPGFNLSFRDESNVADTAVFGRDTDSQYLRLETYYGREWWRVDYAFGRNVLENRGGGIELRQYRNDLRASAAKSFLDDRVALNLSSSISRVDRDTEVAGTTLAEPVPAQAGLFALDTSPDIGTLAPAPDLIDGDVSTPASPVIEIGGGNTFRNIGLDLGLKTQVTRLEVSVDTLSDPGVVWDVYHSPDNLIWEPVGGAASQFDAVFLRYTLVFPETTDRYFKAVNRSANSEPLVRVTEVRALLDVFDAGSPVQASDTESTLYRANAVASLRPNDWVSGRVEIGLTNDEDVVAGFTRRDYQTVYAGARVSLVPTPELQWDFGFRYNDSENRREPVLLRTTEAYDVGMRWTPLQTVDVAVSASRRDELDDNDLIQRSRSTRLLLSLDLLTDLRLISDVSYQRLDDPFAGFDRRGWTWHERVESRPTPRWMVSLGYGGTDLETEDGEDVLDRTDFDVRSTWAATAYLSLSGAWFVGKDDGSRNERETFSLSYNPGPKLSISAGYQEYSTRGASSTESDSLTVTYRITAHSVAFGNLSRSNTKDDGVETADVTSSRAGLRVFF
jgi:hypothetical protein